MPLELVEELQTAAIGIVIDLANFSLLQRIEAFQLDQ